MSAEASARGEWNGLAKRTIKVIHSENIEIDPGFEGRRKPTSQYTNSLFATATVQKWPNWKNVLTHRHESHIWPSLSSNIESANRPEYPATFKVIA
jgi:hypothetical protein